MKKNKTSLQKHIAIGREQPNPVTVAIAKSNRIDDDSFPKVKKERKAIAKQMKDGFKKDYKLKKKDKKIPLDVSPRKLEEARWEDSSDVAEVQHKRKTQKSAVFGHLYGKKTEVVLVINHSPLASEKGKYQVLMIMGTHLVPVEVRVVEVGK